MPASIRTTPPPLTWTDLRGIPGRCLASGLFYLGEKDGVSASRWIWCESASTDRGGAEVHGLLSGQGGAKSTGEVYLTKRGVEEVLVDTRACKAAGLPIYRPREDGTAGGARREDGGSVSVAQPADSALERSLVRP